ncbi:MAG: hypothetical protein K9I94_02195 [Bacteroidales bacterium]|nr:hypothetical protein [Bacteroidales bacterium]
MKSISIYLLLILLTIVPAFGQDDEVAFTLEDRDRIMRTEKEVEALGEEMDRRFMSLRSEMNTRFDAVLNRIEVLYWGFGIVIAFIILIFGYIMWDRRTSLHPVRQKTEDLDEKYRKLEHIMREQAKHDKKLAEIMRSAGLL